MKPVIICGGVGTKVWPLSRPSCPKHFLPLLKGKSLFQYTYQSLRLKFKPEEIYVQTTPHQALIAQKQVPKIPRKNYFLEPEMRNQGPATGFMAAKLFKKNPDEPFFLVQVDDLREPPKKFIKMIEMVDRLIQRDQKLITGGFKPQYGIMGIDYMIPGKKLKNTKGINIYQMKKWVWRDSKEKTDQKVKKGLVFAHANHYAWTPRLMLDAYRRHRPDWHTPLQKMIEAFDTSQEEAVVRKEYAKMPKGPAEEVTSHELEKGYVVELPFEWIDIGTWESIDKYLKREKLYKPSDNLIEIDTKNCFVHAPENKMIGLVGVKNLAIIDTPNALLVCRLDQSGRVGEIVKRLPLDSQ